MSKPFSFGRDPRVDEILAMLRAGVIPHDSARAALLHIGLEQFNEDYENGYTIKEQTQQPHAPNLRA